MVIDRRMEASIRQALFVRAGLVAALWVKSKTLIWSSGLLFGDSVVAESCSRGPRLVRERSPGDLRRDLRRPLVREELPVISVPTCGMEPGAVSSLRSLV